MKRIVNINRTVMAGLLAITLGLALARPAQASVTSQSIAKSAFVNGGGKDGTETHGRRGEGDGHETHGRFAKDGTETHGSALTSAA
jgi:hypothetical protein